MTQGFHLADSPASALEVEVLGRRLWLLPEGGVWDAELGMLLVADLHLGKAGVFRESGLAVPDGADAVTLGRLQELVRRLGAGRLLILGDVFHAAGAAARRMALVFHKWAHALDGLKVEVVRGNHDRHIAFADWLPGLRLWPEGAVVDGLELRHFPVETGAGVPILCGHLHPAIKLQHRRSSKLTLPCFWERGGVLVLPAFGEFTGARPIERVPGDRVWVTVAGEVKELRRG
jgi:DNA ligase-associated metallophosphoesterase